MSENKPREFWIDESESGLPQAYDAKTWNWSNTKAIHVIEKSAFDKQAQEIERMKGDRKGLHITCVDLRTEIDRLQATSDMRFRAMESLAKELDEKDPLIKSLQAKCEIYVKALNHISSDFDNTRSWKVAKLAITQAEDVK